MNSHDKRHGGYKGSAQGRGRYSDGFGDAGGFMDETDREVSSLTDRAFRSLCIGEEAVYNDSSPVERHKAFGDESQSQAAVKGSGREMPPRCVAEDYGEVAGTSGIAPMFQLSVTGEAVAKQEQVLAGSCVSHHSNGVIEATWQQRRSSSKVSSLIRAFDTAEYGGGVGVAADAAVMSRDSAYTQGKEPWDGSALLSLQKELSEFSSVYHQSITGGSLPETRNHFHSSEVAAASQIPSNTGSSAPSATFMKSSSGSFDNPRTRNFFLHSEFSPFQTWKEYNRLLYDREALPHVPTTNQSPTWYDSPFYKELTVAHRTQMAQLEVRSSHRKQCNNAPPAEPPASAVCQKAPAIEKRSESAITVNCPPWKRSQDPVKNKFPQNRPCTASPVSDMSRRKDESWLSSGRTSATRHRVQMVADDQTSNSGTPFSISQLLTPTIHPRQGTDSSEILQYALSPSNLDPSLSSESDPRPTPEIKPRNKYKSMSSSLLFNLKDNRKRVKSTYTPTMFKSLEIADHSKQPSQLDSLTGATSDTPLSWTGAPVRANAVELLSVNSPIAQHSKTHAVNYIRRMDGCQSDDYLTLISPKTVREASSYRSFSHTPQETGSIRDKLADAQSGRNVDSLFMASKSNEIPVKNRLDSSSWKAYEIGQDIRHKDPEEYRLPQSFGEKDFTKRDIPILREKEHGENTKARVQYDNKLEAEVTLIKNKTNQDNGVFRTEKVPMIGDIAALLEKDRQLLEAQRENNDKQGAMFSGVKYPNKSEFFANPQKGNGKQELTVMKEKQCTQNELFRKNEVSEIYPSDRVEVRRQNLYVQNEGLNIRQEYRHINQGLCDTQENYCNNLAANKGLHPTREMKYASNEAFGRKEEGKQAVPATIENKPVKNEFVVKGQDSIYLQGQARQRVPSRTDDRSSSNYTSVINQHEKNAQELSQRIANDNKHPNNGAFTVLDLNSTRQVDVESEKNTIFASETANQGKYVLASPRIARHAPIEEFARKDRELEKQRLSAMGEAKHEPVKVQTLIKQYEGSLGENRNGAKVGLFTTGECKEIKSGGVPGTYMSNMLSVTVPEQGKEKVLCAALDITAPSDTVKDHRGFSTELSAASEFERSAKDMLVSAQSKQIQNEALLQKEHETVLTREKGQTRQEMLTSKLKAHAEKEISAIKEKGQAKLETHATKPKELYTLGNKEEEALSTEHVKKSMFPVSGNHLAELDSPTVKEAHGRNGAFANQEASPSAEQVKSVIVRDGENRLAAQAPTTREKEHSRNYIIAKTEKISMRQEELQSIARAKIEAIAGSRIHQPKYANQESSNVHLNSPLSLRKNAENIITGARVNVSQAEAGDAEKEDVHAVKEKEEVKTEGLAEELDHTQNLGIAVYGNHKAKSILPNKEISNVNQVAFISGEHTTHEPENQPVAGEIFLRQRDDTSDVPVNKDRVNHPVPEHVENRITANHEKHEDAIVVTSEQEHANNYLLLSKERATVEQEVPQSIEHIGSNSTVANDEAPLIREGMAALGKGQTETEAAALHENHLAKLQSLASRKSDGAENSAPGIKISSPVKSVNVEGFTENLRQESTQELANKNQGIVVHELPQSLENEKSINETTTTSESPLAKPEAFATRETVDHKNDALANKERMSLRQEAPLFIEHRSKTFAVKENDDFNQVKKECDKNGAENKESDLFRQEEPSVEHIRIKIISHDKVPQVRESIIAIKNAKHKISPLMENPQVKLDYVASRKSEHVAHDPHRSREILDLKQEELAPAVHDESEVSISESTPAKEKSETWDRDHTKLEISQSLEKEDMKNELNVADDNCFENPETVATRETECAKNYDLVKKEKITIGLDEPPSVEHIRIKIISHDVHQPDREKIVSIQKDTISSTGTCQLKLDSQASGKNEKSPENNAVVIPERSRSRKELSPITSKEAETTAVKQRHEAAGEPANKDRDIIVRELSQTVEKANGTNETTTIDESCLAKPEALAPRETECHKSGEEGITDLLEVLPPVEHIIHKATAGEETHGDIQDVSAIGQKEHAEICLPVSKEKLSFKQDEPSVKHDRVQIIPVDDTQQVRDRISVIEKEHFIHETVEDLRVKLDSLAGKNNSSSETNAMGSTEKFDDNLEECPSQTTNESNTVNRNHQLQNFLERMDGKSVMNQAPTSREKELIKNEMAEINEKHLPKPEVLATRETKDSEIDSLVKKETINLGRDLSHSSACTEERNIQKNENHTVLLEVHETSGKEHIQSKVNKETDKCGTAINKEKRSDGQEAKIKANQKPKQELITQVTDSIRQEIPQPRKDERIQKGIVAVNEKHENKREVLLTRKIEPIENILPHSKTVGVKQEENEHIQKETSFNENDNLTQSTPARREHSGSIVHANAREEGLPSTPLTKSTAIEQSHQAKHGLEKRDRENVIQERGQNKIFDIGEHQAKHLLENEQKGRINQAPLPSENIRNKSTSAWETIHNTEEAFAMNKKQDTQNFGVANRVGDRADGSQEETGADIVNYKGKRGTQETQVEKDSERHSLAKRDQENVTHERAPAREGEYLANKTATATENHLASGRVGVGVGDAKNEVLLEKGRDGVEVQVLPLKENEKAQNLRSVTDKIHQAVLANRIGSSDSESPSKIKHAREESIADSDNRRHEQEVISTRPRGRSKSDTIVLDEDLQLKLDILVRRRKEKAERYARAKMDGTNTRQGTHTSTRHTRPEKLMADKNILAKHGLVIDDTGRITYGVSTREKENVRNVTAEGSGSPLAKMEPHVESNKEYGRSDTLAINEAANVRQRELSSRDKEYGQNKMFDFGEHQAKHLLEKEQKGRINQVPLPSENIRNKSSSAREADHNTKEAFAMTKKHDTQNFGVANKVGDRADGIQYETGADIVNYNGKRGAQETQVRMDSEKHRHTNTERIEDRYEIVPPKEKENEKKQVTGKEKQSVRMETGVEEGEDAKWEVFPAKRGIVRKGELSTIEKGPTILDYLLEKDRDRSKRNIHEVKENDTIKQEVQVTKDPAKKEELVQQKKGLMKKEDFAHRGNTTVSNVTAKDREGAKNKELECQERDSGLPEVLVRKYEVPNEYTFVVRDENQIKQVPSEAAEAIAMSSSKQEMDLRKGREFALKGKGETGSISTKGTEYTKTKECVDRRRSSNRREVLMGQNQNLRENTLIIPDRNISKSAADSMNEKERRKWEVISSKRDAKQDLLPKKGNVHAKAEMFSAHEKLHTHPEVHGFTDEAKYNSGKVALSPQRQGHYNKHLMHASDGRDNSHRRNVAPRGNSKLELETVPNAQDEIKETLSLRDNEMEIIAMREHRVKERAVAHQKQLYNEQEALPKQEYARYKTLPIKEKPDIRHEIPAEFKKEVLANNPKDRTEITARDQPNQNIQSQSIQGPHNPYTAPSQPLQANSWRGALVFSPQPGHVNVPSRESYLTVGGAPQSPEEEYKAPPSSRSTQSQMAKGSEEKNVLGEVKKDIGKPGEALQYYAIINDEQRLEAGDRAAASSQSHEKIPKNELSGLVHGELTEGGMAHSLIDNTKAQIPAPRSNTSSPSLGKPILFKVKDYTLRASPVTKAVKPCFRKTLADDQRMGSSQENLSVVDKDDEECGHFKEQVDVPILHNAAATSERASWSRERPSQHSVPAPDFTTARARQAHNIHSAPEFVREEPGHSVVPTIEYVSPREPRSYYRRNRRLEEDGRSSVISTMSEDLESCATSVTGMTEERMSTGTYMENPYERPESACSDIRALGKPPSIPPKSEKALLRAKKLTTRRIKKAEVKAKAESLSPIEHKPLRAVASMPSSPTGLLLSRQPSPTQLARPQYDVEPGYTPHAPSLVAQPFPLTQRKLLQDPNSGQYFVVDMPVPVKTKMFFDPETGKYVQLSVRQSPEVSRSNTSSVELLSPPPYVLYPGFLPMSVSSLPPRRSASQMSAPAALMEGKEKRSDPWRQEAHRQNCNREAELYIEPAYRSHDQPAEKPSYDDKRGKPSQRNSNIIPMSELEDFAMESN